MRRMDSAIVVSLGALLLATGSAAQSAEPASRLDLNRATRAELAALPGIGPVTAERIVRVRERNGPFRCVEEVRALPRLTESQASVLLARTFVGGAGASARCAEPRNPGETAQPGRASTT
jgi:competence ComEA-like helix-hairpin-helix protein